MRLAESITTKDITTVDEVQSVDNTDKVFVNDNGSFKQISVSNLMKQAPSGVTEETDPTVSEWAKQPTKPSYTANEVGALPVGTKIPTKTSDLTNDSGYLTQIPEEYVTETELGQKGYVIEDDIPEKLPSPGILTFTGAVNDTYDGSANKTINIPTGGGEGGTSDYNALANKPKLNGVEIAGNKTSTDYKIVSSEQGIENNGKFLGVGVDGNVTPVDKPTYTADEVGARPDTWTPSAEDVGALPNNTEIPSKTSDLENDSGFITNSNIPEKLPNPQKIIFTGAVSAEYDGSSQQTINIPTGGGSDPYTLPIMSDTQLGGGKAVEKTDEDVPVAVDPSTGQLFVPTYPENTGGGGGTVDPEQIKQAVNEYLDENPPSGGSGITVALKNALLNLASVVVYKDETSGASAYSALESALSQEVSDITLLKISVVCSVSEVAEKTTADELREYLTVTAIYSDKSSEVVNDYDLEGTVVIGENTFTVTYNGKSATFMITGVESDSFVKDIIEVADVSMNAAVGSEMVYAIYNVKAGDIIEYWASWSSSNYNPPKYYDHNPIVKGVDYTQAQTAYGGASLPVDSSEYAHTVLVEYSYGKVTFNPEQDYACVVIRTNPTVSTFSEVGATWRRN